MTDAVKRMFDAAITKRPREFRELLDTEVGKRIYDKINNQYQSTHIDQPVEEQDEDPTDFEDDQDEFDFDDLDFDINEEKDEDEDEDDEDEMDDEDEEEDDEDDEDDEDYVKEQVEAIERKTRGNKSVELTKMKGMLSQTRDPAQKRFTNKHHVQKTDDRNGNGDDVFNATNVASVERQPMHGYNPGEDEVVYERALSKDEMERRNDIADSMLEDDKAVKDFKKRYGADWKSVMMAVATKQAKK